MVPLNHVIQVFAGLHLHTAWQGPGGFQLGAGLVRGGVAVQRDHSRDSMRPIALGRKNWIHLGNERAGPGVAALLLAVKSCRRLKLAVRDYLGSVLPGSTNFSIRRIAELTPCAWSAARARP